MSAPAPAIRFSDVLTTASAVANYLGEADVAAVHLRHALAILLEEMTLEDLGRPLSPLVRRAAAPGATEEVRDLVGRWFEMLDRDPMAELTVEQLDRLRAELQAVAPDDQPGSPARPG